MIRVPELVDLPPAPPGAAAPDRANSMEVPFDGIAGMGIRIEPWYGANGQRFIGLTFTSDSDEESHDLTSHQALALRDALTTLATSSD